DRPGWRAVDARFTAAAAAADVLVSAPGMGALAAWSCFRTPLLALVTDQPEQADNARDLARLDGPPSLVLPLAALCQRARPRRLPRLAGGRAPAPVAPPPAPSLPPPAPPAAAPAVGAGGAAPVCLPAHRAPLPRPRRWGRRLAPGTRPTAR